MSSYALCLKCVSSTFYQEQPWKCSCHAVCLSSCRGGSRHALWPRCPRHLPHEMGTGEKIGKEVMWGSKQNDILNTAAIYIAIYSGILYGSLTFRLKRYSKHQWGHRKSISQLTGYVNSTRLTNLSITYGAHVTYVKLETALRV